MHDPERQTGNSEPCSHCATDCELCSHCHERAIPAGHRKYCEVCSPRASLIWKREFRVECRRRGVSYQYPWADEKRRRDYHREYMRRWRARRRGSDSGKRPAAAPGAEESVHRGERVRCQADVASTLRILGKELASDCNQVTRPTGEEDRHA